MMYNIEAHIPQQVETLLQCYNKADVEGMNLCLQNLLNLIKDKTFRLRLKTFESERQQHIQRIKDNTINALKTGFNEKNTVEDLQQHYEMVIGGFVKQLDDNEKKYWDVVKEYITNYVVEKKPLYPVVDEHQGVSDMVDQVISP